MSEKMKAEFEEWFESSYGFGLVKEIDGSFSIPWVNDMLKAWQASRAALVVELPSDATNDYFADCYNKAISDVEESLRSYGVKCK